MEPHIYSSFPPQYLKPVLACSFFIALLLSVSVKFTRIHLTKRSCCADCLDIGAARALLDSDHYALDKLKRRVLEYLAVRQLKTSLKVGFPQLIVQ